MLASTAEIIDSVLIIAGANGDDTILTNRELELIPEEDGGGYTITVTITINGVESAFLEDDFTSATIESFDGDDVINAHRIFRATHISAGSGNDHVTGAITIGSPSGSVIHGNAGRDTLIGRERDDTIHGDNGNDWISGGSDGRGHDLLYGDNGNDQLYGGIGNDTLRGGEGDDILRGQRDDDRLVPGSGADRVRGGEGDDRIFADDVEAFGAFDDLNGGDDDDFARIDNDDILISIETTIIDSLVIPTRMAHQLEASPG